MYYQTFVRPNVDYVKSMSKHLKNQVDKNLFKEDYVCISVDDEIAFGAIICEEGKQEYLEFKRISEIEEGILLIFFNPNYAGGFTSYTFVEKVEDITEQNIADVLYDHLKKKTERKLAEMVAA